MDSSILLAIAFVLCVLIGCVMLYFRSRYDRGKMTREQYGKAENRWIVIIIGLGLLLVLYLWPSLS